MITYIVIALIILALIISSGEDKKTVLLVYNDNCIHCTNFMPIWKELKRSKLRRRFNFKERHINSRISEKYNIRSVPTILLLNSSNDMYKKFNGTRTYRDIRNWLNSKE